MLPSLCSHPFFPSIPAKSLIDGAGNLRSNDMFLALNTHIGWIDAGFHMQMAGNNVKAWVDAGQFDGVAALLQVRMWVLVWC